MMRQTFDELWIVDLEGGSRGARKTANIFNIQTPVAIAIGIRYGGSTVDKPARVHYTKIKGTRTEKLTRLFNVNGFGCLDWTRCMEGWQQPLLPKGEGDYYDWPKVIDVFPWQHSGVQLKRAWPIGETKEVLVKRWRTLLSSSDRATAFKESRDRKVNSGYGELEDQTRRMKPIANIPEDAHVPELVKYVHRSFDRQWIIKDARLGDFMKPVLWKTHSESQIHLISLLTDVTGGGPAATIASEIPDLNSFQGNSGAKNILPLWRDATATSPNITSELLETLSEEYGEAVSPEDLFSYAYAVLGSPAYTETFAEELSIPGPRLPITKDHALFRRGAELGRWLIGLHTYGERFSGSVPRGKARVEKAIPDSPESYPEDYSYDPVEKTLKVGEGEIRPVEPEVYEYNVSGLEVVKSWLGYRKKNPTGKKSSPLDEIRPERWTGDMTRELLELLWVLEATVDKEPELAELLAEVTSSEVFTADELPTPTEEERKPPKVKPDNQQEELT